MSRRIEGLDLLRGIAIGLVVLHHALPGPLPGAGVVGVVVFFALSGYLITGLLLTELSSTGRVDLRRFYLRRARRLVPALLALVVGVVLVTLLLDPLHDRDRLPTTVAVALTWTGDLPIGHPSAATFHLWTLATEEQFYLLWPAVLAVAFVRRRVNTALLLAGAGCLLACVAVLVRLREDPDLAYVLPTSWAVCLVVGAAVRFHRDRLAVHALPRWSVPVALAGLMALSVVPLRGSFLTYLAGGPTIAALTGVLLLAWHRWETVTSPPLRALVWLGTVSYAAYLWNYPLTLWLRPSLGAVAGVVAVVLTLLAAALSTRWVERPWLASSQERVAVTP